MASILIKNVLLQDLSKTNVLIEGNRFTSLHASSDTKADKVIEAEGMAILPPFYNMHTHSPMTVLRGYADDMPLEKWLNEYIWPFEGKITAEDIRRGSELAVREMIKSGTVFFNDMYFFIEETIDVVEKYGLRAAIGITFMDNHPQVLRAEKTKLIQEWQDRANGRITIVAAPHAVYTVNTENLQYAAKVAREKGIKITIHAAETETEVADCVAAHGLTPIKYLDSIGFLGPDVIIAHGVHVTDEEIDILNKRGVTICHCPCSNMKLGSGMFRYREMTDKGAHVTLGTDGASSNNNLDMREEMKFAALFAKWKGDVECLPAETVFDWATRAGAEAFGIDAGVIAEGKLADCILIDINNEKMQPCFNLISNWVYSADSSIIDTVICDGNILMQGREITPLK